MLNAAQIITISDEFSQRIIESRQIQIEKIAAVWNWYDAIVTPEEKWNDYRKEIAPESDSCVIMYAGNIGLSQGLEHVLTTAELLRDHQDIQFVFVGDGANLDNLLAQAKQRQM